MELAQRTPEASMSFAGDPEEPNTLYLKVAPRDISYTIPEEVYTKYGPIVEETVHIWVADHRRKYSCFLLSPSIAKFVHIRALYLENGSGPIVQRDTIDALSALPNLDTLVLSVPYSPLFFTRPFPRLYRLTIKYATDTISFSKEVLRRFGATLRLFTLVNCEITTIPHQWFKHMTELIGLEIKYCKAIDAIPSTLSNLRKLHYLHIQKTAIEELPDVFAELPLETCILPSNRLKTLPLSICSTAAKMLDVSHNRLTALPGGLYGRFPTAPAWTVNNDASENPMLPFGDRGDRAKLLEASSPTLLALTALHILQHIDDPATIHPLVPEEMQAYLATHARYRCGACGRKTVRDGYRAKIGVPVYLPRARLDPPYDVVFDFYFDTHRCMRDFVVVLSSEIESVYLYEPQKNKMVLVSYHRAFGLQGLRTTGPSDSKIRGEHAPLAPPCFAFFPPHGGLGRSVGQRGRYAGGHPGCHGRGGQE